MKQAKVNLPSVEYLLAEIAVWGSDKNPIYDDVLFPGSWQLLGADPTRLTEEEAGEIVGMEVGEAPYVPYYRPYGMSEEEYIHESRIAENKLAQWEHENMPTNRLDSLAASLGISKPFVVLKNKNDDNT